MEETGQGMAEYGLILALVFLAVFSGFSLLAVAIQGSLSDVTGLLE
jgi:Flp pilus assembly pilin Flp